MLTPILILWVIVILFYCHPKIVFYITAINQLSIKSRLFLFFFPPLKRHCPEAFTVAQNILRRSGYAPKNIKFFVDITSTHSQMIGCALVGNKNKPIILSLKILNSQYLDVVLAHEIGHVVLNHYGQDCNYLNELEAFQFAAKICGFEKTLNAIRDLNINDGGKLTTDLLSMNLKK